MDETRIQPSQTQKRSKSTKPEPKWEDLARYPELSDAELEVVCGGGNWIGRNTHK